MTQLLTDGACLEREFQQQRDAPRAHRGVHAYSNGQVTIPREQNRPTSWRPECVVRRRFESIATPSVRCDGQRVPSLRPRARSANRIRS
jgi:hypothetical protein